MYLFDTNICVYAMKGRHPQLTERIYAMDPGDICISSVTVFELEYGCARSQWPDQTRRNTEIFLAPFSILPFDRKDAILAGQIRASLAKIGQNIGAYDLMIAAQGVARSLTVVTHNTKEFIRVPGISLDDWLV